jgi:hypothetical protein
MLSGRGRDARMQQDGSAKGPENVRKTGASTHTFVGLEQGWEAARRGGCLAADATTRLPLATLREARVGQAERDSYNERPAKVGECWMALNGHLTKGIGRGCGAAGARGWAAARTEQSIVGCGAISRGGSRSRQRGAENKKQRKEQGKSEQKTGGSGARVQGPAGRHAALGAATCFA